MRSRIIRCSLAAAVVAGGAASSTGQEHITSANPLFDHPPKVIHHPPPPHPQAGHAEGHGHLGRKHDPRHLKDHADKHCKPGVYKTEVPHFRGNGFVARKRPYTADQNTMERAGFPHQIASHAEPSYDHRYTGYHVGGGVSLLNKVPGFRHSPKEGTWGWDYDHLGLKRRVNLLFSRGALYQDGDGQYEPDPPFEITNVFAIRYGERLHRALGIEGE